MYFGHLVGFLFIPEGFFSQLFNSYFFIFLNNSKPYSQPIIFPMQLLCKRAFAVNQSQASSCNRIDILPNTRVLHLQVAWRWTFIWGETFPVLLGEGRTPLSNEMAEMWGESGWMPSIYWGLWMVGEKQKGVMADTGGEAGEVGGGGAGGHTLRVESSPFLG